MRIALSNDHAGFPLKDHVVGHLGKLGHEVLDLGTSDDEPVDFPLQTRKVTTAVVEGRADRGVLVCGTGVGASIAANKVPGIRAAVIHDVHSAHQGVEHDDVNVACLGAWIVGLKTAEETLEAFLDARFADTEEVRRRVAQLGEMDTALRRQ